MYFSDLIQLYGTKIVAAGRDKMLSLSTESFGVLYVILKPVVFEPAWQQLKKLGELDFIGE